MYAVEQVTTYFFFDNWKWREGTGQGLIQMTHLEDSSSDSESDASSVSSSSSNHDDSDTYSEESDEEVDHGFTGDSATEQTLRTAFFFPSVLIRHII